jgi:hypothetical protein
MNCQFCDKDFQENIHLYRHQRTKACLLVQRKIQDALNDQKSIYDLEIFKLENMLKKTTEYYENKITNLEIEFHRQIELQKDELNEKIQNLLLSKIENKAAVDQVKFDNQQRLRNEISVDISLYKEMDVIYTGTFTPNYEHLAEECIEDEDVSYCVLGFSKNICNRVSGYKNDKNFNNFKITNIFPTKNTAVSEKRLKTITSDMGLTISYAKYKECFKATPDELTLVVEYIKEHIDNLNDTCKVVESDNIEVEKYKIEVDAQNDQKIRIEKMFRDGLISFDQMIMINNK